MYWRKEVIGSGYLLLVEFSYKNNFRSSIKMEPFMALYGRRSMIPLCWYDSDENVVLGLEIIQQTTEKIEMIQEKMKDSQSPKELS